MAAAARLVADQAQPSPGLLADEQVDLWSVGKEGVSAARAARLTRLGIREQGDVRSAGRSQRAIEQREDQCGDIAGSQARAEFGIGPAQHLRIDRSGLTQMALMPCGLPSTAIASVRPMTPYLETL